MVLFLKFRWSAQMQIHFETFNVNCNFPKMTRYVIVDVFSDNFIAIKNCNAAS